MADSIGNINVPEIVASGTFPIIPEYPYGCASHPEVAIHQFGSGNSSTPAYRSTPHLVPDRPFLHDLRDAAVTRGHSLPARAAACRRNATSPAALSSARRPFARHRGPEISGF
jgi:hypothetical protein